MKLLIKFLYLLLVFLLFCKSFHTLLLNLLFYEWMFSFNTIIKSWLLLCYKLPNSLFMLMFRSWLILWMSVASFMLNLDVPEFLLSKCSCVIHWSEHFKMKFFQMIVNLISITNFCRVSSSFGYKIWFHRTWCWAFSSLWFLRRQV